MKSFRAWQRGIQSFLLCFALLFSLSAASASATETINFSSATESTKSNTTPVLIPPPPTLSANGYVVMDANTGKILAQQNMDKRVGPASLTKMMTLYLTFSALQNGQIKLDDQVRISERAWRMSGSRMFVKYNTMVSVEDLIQGVIVASGNDACVALAEHIGGTEETFADLMNQTAARLHMTDSHYVDSTGMPNAEHYSTPHDMALLAQALIRDFPEYYHYFGQKWLKYNDIRQPNRNRMLWRDPNVDGLKTGHTEEAGYCLVASAKHNDMRLVTVLMGAPSDSARADSTQALLNYGFRFYKTYPLFQANQSITKPRVWLAKNKYANLGLSAPLYASVPTAEYKNLKATMTLNNRLTAPIVKGQSYGRIDITLNGEAISSAPLVALEDDPKSGLFSRLIDHVVMLVRG